MSERQAIKHVISRENRRASATTRGTEGSGEERARAENWKYSGESAEWGGGVGRKEGVKCEQDK